MISVIVPSFNARETVRECLDSLRRQRAAGAFKVILVDSSRDGTAELVASEYPEVSVYHFEERKFCGDARNFGLSVAGGDIIAQVDADCRAAPDWVERTTLAHRAGYQVVGGAIANGNPQSWIGWAAYFCEFSQWMPGGEATWMIDVPGANVSYKREVLDHYGPFIAGTYGSDTELHWRLQRDGLRIRFEPSLIVYHHNREELAGFLRHEFEHGRDFAGMRCQSQAFPRLKRLLYSLFFPLLALKVFSVRTKQNLKNRIYLRHFLKAFPLVFLGVFCWCLGEADGYLRGYSRRPEAGQSPLINQSPPESQGYAGSPVPNRFTS